MFFMLLGGREKSRTFVIGLHLMEGFERRVCANNTTCICAMNL